MLVPQELPERLDRENPILLPDQLFLCPLCGSAGVFGDFGFTRTERPGWFRCECCQYVFGLTNRRPNQIAGALL